MFNSLSKSKSLESLQSLRISHSTTWLNDNEAILVEPLAAALEILEQVNIKPADKIAVLGDGKLGLLISLVLSTMQKYIFFLFVVSPRFF